MNEEISGNDHQVRTIRYCRLIRLGPSRMGRCGGKGMGSGIEKNN